MPEPTTFARYTSACLFCEACAVHQVDYPELSGSLIEDAMQRARCRGLAENMAQAWFEHHMLKHHLPLVAGAEVREKK